MTRPLIVVRDRFNSPFAAALGQPWIGFCRACQRGASFPAWDYALHWATTHCTEATSTHSLGFGYSRSIDNGNPATTTPDGVELIPITGRRQRRTAATVEKGHPRSSKPKCDALNPGSSRNANCGQPEGHDGNHTNGYSEWTGAQSARRSFSPAPAAEKGH